MAVGEVKEQTSPKTSTQGQRIRRCEVSRLKIDTKEEISPRGHSLRTGDVSRLEPYLGADGLIRVGGRLKRAALHPEQRTPYCYPGTKSTELIVQEVHSTRAGHSGHEHTYV
ncbi:uncharacterized protein LOC121862002 [Homarus americanus]|uniref:uncharacterized protein LOC121862002 n=1 Tax=Homarus americanus TaxID=6706 RepID=UPI001C49489A|nr:uncharacterized protein LOC121862002 [Homarus americanus]